MSTIAEIEEAIEQLSPEDFRLLRRRLEERANKASRRWSSEELEAAAQRMVDEPDRARAHAMWEEIAAGFYGEGDA